MAIETVDMWQNTSIIPDENLAHRMGLIPILADATMFEHKIKGGENTTTNSIRFRLHAECTKKADGLAPLNNTQDEDALYNNANVYSGDLEWVPLDGQEEMFENAPRPLLDDILIAKMRPGQEIEMEVVCEKGEGKTHAKWSPVCTAFYRLMPDIRIIGEDITGEDAEELKALCPMGVFDIEDMGKAVVADARKCTTCRECVRHEKFENRVDVGKLKDHFEFHVESVGMYAPEKLVFEALKILKAKAVHWLEVIEAEESH
jgi:DNA-directed RNA polymerase I and III subunit RPAC1